MDPRLRLAMIGFRTYLLWVSFQAFSLEELGQSELIRYSDFRGKFSAENAVGVVEANLAIDEEFEQVW